MSFTAHPIFSCNQVLASYNDRNLLPNLLATRYDFNAIKSINTVPIKDCDNPASLYYTWFNKFDKGDINFNLERKKWVAQVKTGSNADVPLDNNVPKERRPRTLSDDDVDVVLTQIYR
jgi:hypothetical protein